MKIIIYSTNNKVHDGDELLELINALNDSGVEYCVSERLGETIGEKTGIELDASRLYNDFSVAALEADVVVSYGGDGTFIRAVKLLKFTQKPILGINSGRLGFLANVAKESTREALGRLIRGEYKIEESLLLKVEGDFDDQPEFPYAFNEVAIERKNAAMAEIDAYVDGEMVATYRGDGVLVSTPAGSTAYALSVGGPVVAPRCACMIIAPIASHNLTIRPVVISDDSQVDFKAMLRGGRILVEIDGVSYEARSGAKFRITKSSHKARLVRLKGHSYYDTLREKLFWGVDKRDALK